MYNGIYRTDPAPQRAQPSAILAIPAGITQPPPMGPLSVAMMVGIALSWPQTSNATLPQPQVGRNYIAPLLLVYGQQPPINGPLQEDDNRIVRSWWPETTDAAQIQVGYKAATVDAASLPPAQPPAFSVTQILSSIQYAWTPPEFVVLPNVGAAAFIPVAGDQPPPLSPLPKQILTAWQPPFVSPPPLKPAPEPSVDVPRPVGDRYWFNIVSAWQPPWIAPPLPVQLVEKGGESQPPEYEGVIVSYDEIIASWVPPFIMPQRLVQIALFTAAQPLKAVPYAPLPNSVLISWLPPIPFKQQLATNGFQPGVAPSAALQEDRNLGWL